MRPFLATLIAALLATSATAGERERWHIRQIVGLLDGIDIGVDVDVGPVSPREFTPAPPSLPKAPIHSRPIIGDPARLLIDRIGIEGIRLRISDKSDEEKQKLRTLCRDILESFAASQLAGTRPHYPESIVQICHIVRELEETP